MCDNETIIAHAQATSVVAAAADGDEELMFAAEIDRRDNVCHIDAARDGTRWPIDHAVVDFARLIVGRVIRLD
jgi:hypothetical protein